MGGTGDIDSHLLADEVRGLFRHQPVGHQFPSGDGDQILYAISLPVIDQSKSPADRAIIAFSARIEIKV